MPLLSPQFIIIIFIIIIANIGGRKVPRREKMLAFLPDWLDKDSKIPAEKKGKKKDQAKSNDMHETTTLIIINPALT
jgi:hypothetical protein